MFYVPGILNTRHGSKLTRCWLAGTLSEKVFNRKVGNHQITEYEIEEYCEEILKVFNDKRVSNRWLFSLHLFSHLMFGVVKLYSYQFILFENSVFSMVHALDVFDYGTGKQNSRRREKSRGAQLAKISQIPIDELLMPLTPELNLDRPFRRDMNLLYEISPVSHRRMIELDESNLVRFSPLTESQAKLWLSNDEGCLWFVPIFSQIFISTVNATRLLPLTVIVVTLFLILMQLIFHPAFRTNIDTSQFPASESRPINVEFVHPAAIESARADLPMRVLRTPTKRTSTQKNLGTPSKRQRPSRIPQLDTLDKETTELAVPAVVPMEQDGEPLPLRDEPMVTEAPENPMDLVDPVPAIFPMEQDIEPHPLPEHQVAPVDPVPAIFPIEQDVEPHPLPEHQVAPVDPVPAIFPMEQDLEPHPLPEHQVAPVPPVDQVENATVVERAVQPVKPKTRLGYRGKKVKIVDAIKTISEVKLKQRENNVQAYTESAWITRSVPTKKLVRRMFLLPSMIFIFGTENIRHNRLRKISDELLRRHEINICGPFDVETDLSNFRPRDLPRRRTDDALTVLGNETDTGKSPENGIVIQRVEVTVAPPDEVPQAEVTDGPAFDMVGEAQFPLGDIEQIEHSVNISDATAAIVTGADNGKSTENRTAIQPTEPNVAQPAEAPLAEAANEPAFDATSGIQLPLGNIDQTGHPENTSDTIIASFKKVQISTDLARSKGTDRRSSPTRSDWTMYSPRSKDQVKVEKSSSSKSRSSGEFIIDNGRELSSPRAGMAANVVWTRKDLEANLEVHWHVNNIISFEQIAPPNETSAVDAIACLSLLLDMYRENKVILTQARTDAPIYIEKGVTSDAMDWS